MTSKLLWDDAYLEHFAKSLHDGCPLQFWDYDKDGELEEIKPKHIRKLMRVFYPALGFYNLHINKTEGGKSLSDTQPIFKRGCLVEEVEPKTIFAITKRVFHMMNQPLGDELDGLFQGKFERVWTTNALTGLPVLPDLLPSVDTLDTCTRYFRNGWLEITKDGVSELKSYEDSKEDLIVWNHVVIDRDYVADDGSNAPVDTHFKDFVQNICSDLEDEGDLIVNKKSLDNIELAIGYLCHRFNDDSNRRWVLFVDKFYDGLDPNVSNGGTGKSMLVKCLGHVMNLVELSGRTMTSKKDNVNMWSRVNRAHELVLIDDCSNKFPTDLLLTNTTGDFHIEGKWKQSLSIPAKEAPKIVLTSNFPLKGEGNTYERRQFICEVGNYYLVQQQEYGDSPMTLHGHKRFCSWQWSETDWSEFYKYIFGCISKYLAKGGLPKSNESDYYQRAKLIEMVGNTSLFEYLLGRLDEYHRSGEEVFTQKFYADVRSNFPVETMDIKDDGKFYAWIKEIGKAFKMYVNRSTHGKQKLERLKTKSRWQKWIADGMQGTRNNAGKEITEDDRVYVFSVSSPKRPNGSFYSQPNFNKENP